eukprot:scaffold202814_cov14-Tisochrysis_lutea.AAC.1
MELANLIQEKLAEAEQGARDAAATVSEMEEMITEKEQSIAELGDQVRAWGRVLLAAEACCA